MRDVHEQTDQPAPPSARVVLRWFRLAGLPLFAIMIIATAVLLLQERKDSNRVQLDTADAGEPSITKAEEGQPAPDFTLSASDGTTYRLSELRGRPVMINFWATWCGPCKEEMPAIDEAYQAYKGSGFIVLAVNVEESAAPVDRYVSKLKLTFPVLLDPSGSVSARYRVRSLPTTVFVRPDGIIDGMRAGSYSRRLLLGRIEQFIAPE